MTQDHTFCTFKIIPLKYEKLVDLFVTHHHLNHTCIINILLRNLKLSDMMYWQLLLILWHWSSCHTNPLAQSTAQVKLDPDKWKLYKKTFQQYSWHILYCYATNTESIINILVDRQGDLFKINLLWKTYLAKRYIQHKFRIFQVNPTHKETILEQQKSLVTLQVFLILNGNSLQSLQSCCLW